MSFVQGFRKGFLGLWAERFEWGCRVFAADAFHVRVKVRCFGAF